MSNSRRSRPAGWSRPYWAPKWAPGPVYHVVLELRDGHLREYELDARVHGRLCATCGAIEYAGDPHDGTSVCGHDEGHCTERVLAAAAKAGPGKVLAA